MSLSLELLKSMDPQHAINALRADHNPLTSTALETYLIEWVESLVDQSADAVPYVEAAENCNFSASDIDMLGEMVGDYDLDTLAKLVEVLGTAGIATAETLKSRLDLADRFIEIAEDAGDFLPRLTDLITTTQE